jgi:hypothetical protein
LVAPTANKAEYPNECSGSDGIIRIAYDPNSEINLLYYIVSPQSGYGTDYTIEVTYNGSLYNSLYSSNFPASKTGTYKLTFILSKKTKSYWYSGDINNADQSNVGDIEFTIEITKLAIEINSWTGTGKDKDATINVDLQNASNFIEYTYKDDNDNVLTESQLVKGVHYYKVASIKSAYANDMELVQGTSTATENKSCSFEFTIPLKDGIDIPVANANKAPNGKIAYTGEGYDLLKYITYAEADYAKGYFTIDITCNGSPFNGVTANTSKYVVLNVGTYELTFSLNNTNDYYWYNGVEDFTNTGNIQIEFEITAVTITVTGWTTNSDGEPVATVDGAYNSDWYVYKYYLADDTTKTLVTSGLTAGKTYMKEVYVPSAYAGNVSLVGGTDSNGETVPTACRFDCTTSTTGGKVINVPTSNVGATGVDYNGTVDLLTYITYDSTNTIISVITLNGSAYTGSPLVTSATEAGTYIITFALKNSVDTWSDTSQGTQQITITINAITITVTGWNGTDQTATAILDKTTYNSAIYEYKFIDVATNNEVAEANLVDGTTYKKTICAANSSVTVQGSGVDVFVRFTYTSTNNGNNPSGGDTGNGNNPSGGDTGNGNNPSGGDTGNGNNPSGGDTGNGSDNGSTGGDTGNGNNPSGGDTGNGNNPSGGDTGNGNNPSGGDTGNGNNPSGGDTGNGNNPSGGDTGNGNNPSGGDTGNGNNPSGGDTGNGSDNGSTGGDTGNGNNPSGGDTGNGNNPSGGDTGNGGAGTVNATPTVVNVTKLSVNYTFNCETQTIKISDVTNGNSTILEISGTYSAKAVGTYKAVLRIKTGANAKWADGTTLNADGNVEINWTIDPATDVTASWTTDTNPPTMTFPKDSPLHGHEDEIFDYIYTDPETGKEVPADKLEDGKDYKVTAKIKEDQGGNISLDPDSEAKASTAQTFTKQSDEGFPWWLIVVIVVGVILAIVFFVSGTKAGNNAKKSDKKRKQLNYSIVSGGMLFGISSATWEIVAYVVLAICAICLIYMIINKIRQSKADEALDDAKTEAKARKEEERERRQEEMQKMYMGGGYQPQQPIYAQPPVYGVPPVYVTGQPNQNGDQNGDNSNGEQKPVNGQQPVIVYYANQPAQQGTPLLGTGDFDALVDKVLAAIVPAVQQRQVNVNTDNVTTSTDKPEQPKQSDTYIYNNNTAPATSGVDDVTKAILDQQSKVMDQQTKMLEQQAALIEELKKKALTDPDDEDEDEWSDEDEEEDFYDTDIEDEDQEQVPENKRVRIPSNFRVRLKASSDKCKTFYTELKNGLNSYKGFTFRMSGRLEKVNYHGETIAMIGVVRKALKLWLALDPNAYDFERYHQKDASDKKRYEHVPMQVRIGSARALKRAEELLDRLLENHQAEVRNKYQPRNLQELAYTLKLNKLVKDKRKELLCQSIHVHDADVISDEDAARYLEIRDKAPVDVENFANISLDVLDEKFLDGNKVTLQKLKKKELVPEDCNGYTVTAGTRLSKPLYVIADDISLPAVKMITLTGGRAIKLVVPQTEAE